MSSENSGRHQRPRGFTLASLYRAAAYLTFNTILVFVAMNLVLAIVFLVRDRWSDPQSTPPIDPRLSDYRHRFADLEAYARISPELANRFLDEQDAKGSLGLRFHPWLQFREPTFRGSLLNTDNEGFRATRSPSARAGAPEDVFVFGGSTTFGYGVPDDYTIPSYLQLLLERRYPAKSIRVRNFGQAYYYSSQEMLLFILLLKGGRIPAHAVFIDGGNDAAQLGPLRDEPIFSPRLAALWEGGQAAAPARSSLEQFEGIPIVRLALGISRRLSSPTRKPSVDVAPTLHRLIFTEDASEEISRERSDFVISRYTTNVRVSRAICREYSVDCLFVWQPHVVYKYDRRLHRHFPFPGDVPRFYRDIWQQMERASAPDFLYLGNLLEHKMTKVFVDDVHYNEALNDEIAEAISARLHVR